MNKKEQKLYQHKDIPHRCSRCNLVSKSVHKSLKFKDYLCMDCLKDIILQNG